MDSLGMWKNVHQHHPIHEEIFSQEITASMINSQHISPPNPMSVMQNNSYSDVVVLNSPSPLIMPTLCTRKLSTKSASLDSLDCLLSATNSINTDTSVKDDGISVIFSSPQLASPPPPLEITKKPFSISKRTYDQMNQVLSFERGENSKNSKKPRFARCQNLTNISFQQQSDSSVSSEEIDPKAIKQMKEMIYRAAAFRPVNLGVDIVEKPKRKNVKISSDPQTVAARQRRERIGERIRVLQRLVPGGNKMDTALMLDEAANYLKFLRSQVKTLESINSYKLDHHHLVNFNNHHLVNLGSFNVNPSLFPMQNYFPYQTTLSPIHGTKD